MSWASKRRFSYALGVAIFFLIIFGTPVAYWYFSIPPTCSDGIQNNGETAIDRGGACPLVDERSLTAAGVLWARSFRVRDGVYNAVAYLQNPNAGAGVLSAHYRFRLYDERNVLVAEREGTTYIMPSAITPIFAGNIDTGNRAVSHTAFEFTDSLVWQKLNDTSGLLSITNTDLRDETTDPRVTAQVQNTSVGDMRNLEFVAIISDPAGNAFAASQTALPVLNAGVTEQIVFTWPDRLNVSVGRVLVVPLSKPIMPRENVQ